MSHFEEASRYIAGGVNSPVRAFRGVGGEPPFIRRASGAYVETEDGRRLIDYVGSWGPMILGHAHPDVIAAVTRRAADGLSFGAPTLVETELARAINRLVPSIELLRMVSSGTEATMSAIRLARGYTGRERIVKFEGCYHGHSDALLVKAGSGALTLGVPDSAGVPPAVAAATTTLPYNDPAALERAFAEAGRQFACACISDRAAGYGMPGTTVDGTDVLKMLNAVKTAVDRARKGDGPTLIESVTMRMRGHSEHDDASYVPKGMADAWAAWER